MPETSHYSWDNAVPYGDAKADRRLIPGQAGDLKRVMVKAGTVAARHEHAFEQFVMIAEGQGVLLCAEGEIALRPGTVIYFTPHAWHEARFETDTVLYEVNFRE